ncbi:hypothetical protein [Effusibacillus consociatus]|uniref:Uncharacterized protein n=1 Tax=Effusibacillus consociatus TaxID=1117041 RepID=A0ABV9Q0L9_9BACL
MFGKRFQVVLTLFVFLAAGIFSPSATGASGQVISDSQMNQNRQVILVVADLLKESDLQNQHLPHLREWAEQGGIGLMNVNAPVNWFSYRGEGLTVIDWNELRNLESTKEKLLNSQYIQLRQRSLQSLDRLAEQLLPQADDSTLLILASPRTTLVGKSGELAPVFAAGGPIAPGSLLTSASTRRKGIVTNQDLGASIQDFLGLQEAGAVGRTIQSTKSDANPWDEFHKTAVQTREIYGKRTVVITSFGAAGGILFLLMTGILLSNAGRKRVGERAKLLAAVLIWGGTAVLTAPFFLLLLPVVEWFGKWRWLTEDWIWIVVVPGVILGTVWALMQIRNLFQRLLLLAIGMVGLIITDTATGGWLAHGSILSYDPVVGARYYGVGNESMAFLVTWLLLAYGYVLCLQPRWKRWMKWGFAGMGGGMIWFFAAPELGANAGGTVTAAASVAVAVTFLFQLPKRVSWPVGLTILASSIAFMITLHQGTAYPTHVTQAVNLAGGGQYDRIGELVMRKLLMNLHLIRDYVGAPLVVIVLLIAATAVLQPFPPVARFLEEKAGLRPFLTGGVAGSLIGFAANDSGVVVAALILMPIVYTVCMIKLVEVFPTPHTIVPDALSHLDRPDWSPGHDPDR